VRGARPSPVRLAAVAALLLALAGGCRGVGAGPPAAPRDRFEIAGLDAARVRTSFEALQAAVASEDRAALALQVSFPLRVAGRKVRTAEEMWREYRSIWTPAVQRVVLAQRFDELFVNVHGVMIGDGVVWLAGVCADASPAGTCADAKVRVTAVNPDAAK
jgi:hypothetical protein